MASFFYASFVDAIAGRRIDTYGDTDTAYGGAARCVVDVTVPVVVVFTLDRSFYPTSSAVPTASFLILHPREIQIMRSKTMREKNQTPKIQGRQIKC